MTPLSFNPTPALPLNPESSLVPFTFLFAAADDQPVPPPPRRASHGKQRDASSPFIRSQQVAGKVEGNPGNLSKIIGMYWKTLAKEGHVEWEPKAALAQLEHRKRYPDWQFHPGANALAKLKIKDGGGGAGPSRQRRIRGDAQHTGKSCLEGDIAA
ncbi:putative high mobility group [Lyophyllum shimeji]|uniref:High mobility group n=1 Tax=Lyophyllum shimeji TaxID=47721 RepID=A0A9P3PUM2_LYOSH|nr:putative high mobility group [Lyophyllum shimeji]